MRVILLTLFITVFSGCASHSSIIQSQLGFNDDTVFTSPRLVMNSEVFFNTNSFNLGALWHKSLEDKVIIVVKLNEGSLQDYTEILGLEFSVKDSEIKLSEYKSKTFHESAFGKSFNLLGGGGSFSFKAYYMKMNDLRNILKYSDTVKVKLSTSSRGIAVGDFKKDFYGSALRGLTSFMSKVDASL